jgi:preprotein translocase subunit SecG
MILTLVNVIYVLVAVAMIALILLQRGAGANAGSGFGAGASATVFGSRGASNFLSKSTAILAAIFFAMSLGMAMYATKGSPVGNSEDLGIMSGAVVPAEETPAAPAATFETPAAPAATAPATPSPATGDVPAAPAPEAATEPATSAPSDGEEGDKGA